jgi:HD-GYP domain-containing protein (c-di-GMP phosphodiesterase class II)
MGSEAQELAALREALAAHEEQATEKEHQLERYAADLRETFKRERARAAELRESYVATVRALANAVEARDAYTGKHAERVSAYGMEIARAGGLTLADDPQVEFGFLLHDIGKVAVPDAILFKPEPLNAAERELIATPLIGFEILRDVSFLGEAKARRAPPPRALGRRRLPRRPGRRGRSRWPRACSRSPTRSTR